MRRPAHDPHVLLKFDAVLCCLCFRLARGANHSGAHAGEKATETHAARWQVELC